MNLRLLIAKGMKIIFNPPALRNCQIDKTSKVCSKSELTQVTMERYSYIGYQSFMVNVDIGSFCSIADNCSIGGAYHPVERVSSSPVFHCGKNILKKNFAKFPSPKTPKTIVENDVWIGMGCYIKAGVTIHNGAVIGMGSVVTHDVPAYEIWAGNPARKIRDRFPDNQKELLINSKWWNLSDSELQRYAEYFNNPQQLMGHFTYEN